MGQFAKPEKYLSGGFQVRILKSKKLNEYNKKKFSRLKTKNE